MNRTFSLIHAAAGALVITAMLICSAACFAQSAYTYHPYHYEPYHFQPYSPPAPLATPYHSFTMDPPYAPSPSPSYKYENGQVVGPSGPVWHDNLGHVDSSGLQKRGSDATIGQPYVPAGAGQPYKPLPPALNKMQKIVGEGLPYAARPENAEKEHEKHNDAPPGP